MSAMQNFVMWFLNNLPSFLLSDPIKYFVGFFFAGLTVKLIKEILSISRQSLERGFTMADLITAIGQVVTASVGWITSFVGVITSNPILLIGVIVSFVGLGVGLIKRLMRI